MKFKFYALILFANLFLYQTSYSRVEDNSCKLLEKHTSDLTDAQIASIYKKQNKLPLFILDNKYIYHCLKCTDPSRLGGAGDGTRLGGAGDGTRLGGVGDGTRLGGAGDGTRLGGAGDGTRLGGAGDGTRMGGAGDGTRIGGSGDDSRLGGNNDDSALGGAEDRVRGAGNKFSFSCKFDSDGKYKFYNQRSLKLKIFDGDF